MPVLRLMLFSGLFFLLVTPRLALSQVAPEQGPFSPDSGFNSTEGDPNPGLGRSRGRVPVKKPSSKPASRKKTVPKQALPGLGSTRRPPWVFAGVDVPLSVTWATSLPAVRNQDPCFASWALAPLQAAEAQLKRQGGPWLSLSAQQVLDCTFRAANANETCNGDDDPRFNPLDAARHIQRVGLALEADYLYVPEWASGCRSDVRTYRIPLRLVEVPDGREDMLAQAVVGAGPVVVTLRLSSQNPDLMSYEEGVFDGACDEEGSVSMLLFGFDAATWSLRYFQDNNWGEQGNIRLPRGGNFCGIADHAFAMVYDKQQ